MTRTDDSRRRILEATAAVASELGYDGTTISQVTKRSGLPASSVYWHFADKDELYAEAMSHAFTTWLATQPDKDPLPPGMTLREGVLRIMRPALEALDDPPDYLRMGTMLLLESQHVATVARGRYLEIRAAVESMIREWFARELDEAVLRNAPDLPDQIARLIPAYFDGSFLNRQAALEWDIDRSLDVFMVLVETAIDRAVTAAQPPAPARRARRRGSSASTSPG